MGWFLDDKNLVVAKFGIVPITGKKAFAFAFAKKTGQWTNSTVNPCTSPPSG